MISANKDFVEVKSKISEIKNLTKEIIRTQEYSDKLRGEEKILVSNHLKKLAEGVKQKNLELKTAINKLNVPHKLSGITENKQNDTSNKSEKMSKEEFKYGDKKVEELKAMGLEKETIKRLRRDEEKERELKKFKEKSKKKKKNRSKISNQMFSKFSKKLNKTPMFQTLNMDLIKANLPYTAQGYTSQILFTTFTSIFIGIALAAFFLFFKISATFPIVSFVEESITSRFPKVFWLVIFIPLVTFFGMYLYPSLERKSTEGRINQEIPFATIHMAAISGSMIDPTKIFSIIISTKEYPNIEKEFKKLLNEINVYGYDLVSALRSTAFRSPSKKLAELLSGLATTINSGGDLPEFFNKRADTLLFDHKINKEKATKSAETFMDIYISIVIAAPMVLMLLLMMMKISGLGLSVSSSTITLVMVLGVSIINILFIVFLHMKKTNIQ